MAPASIPMQIVTQLLDTLHDCADYFEHREDTIDGDDGQPRPNREMSLNAIVKQAITALEQSS